MNREQMLDLLMLISALESWAMAQTARLPDYLLEDIGKAVGQLRAQLIEGDKS
jgi:hypothetical protein